MEINIRVQPGEAAELVAALLNEGTAKRVAHAASGAAIALAGGMRFIAKSATEDPDAEFDRFIVSMARHGTIPDDEVVDLIRSQREKGGREADGDARTEPLHT